LGHDDDADQINLDLAAKLFDRQLE